MRNMLDQVIGAYRYVPAPLRNVAATLYGHYMRRWRYSWATESIVKEALRRETWAAAQWHEWRLAKTRETLAHAAENVPYYRQWWQARGVSKPPLELSQWPILRKETVRTSLRDLVADGVKPTRLFRESTSGSTGSPLHVLVDRPTLVTWYGLMEARWRRWYGVSYHDRWAAIGAKHILPLEQRTPPFWLWNGGLRSLHLSLWHAYGNNLPHYLDAIQKYRVEYLWGYPTVLVQLAFAALEQKRRVKLKVVITSAEHLHDFQREAIREAFQCPVYSTYGQTEKVFAMSECEHQRWHLWPSVGAMELLDDRDEPVPPGTPGRLVCTSFINRAMPLVRYDMGDMVQLPANESPCPCGRTLPQVERIVGRSADEVVMRDGRRFSQLDEIFEPPMPVREAQIVQDSYDELRLRIVKAPEWQAADEARLLKLTREIVGDIAIRVEYVSFIERTAGGKVPSIISHVSRKRTAPSVPAHTS